MTEILGINAREILDSRGNPTVEVDLFTADSFYRAMVPSGASTGVHEALELRDRGKRYLGKGVQKAVENINSKITPTIIGKDCTKQEEIDRQLIELDGTQNKSNLGANAILAVSMAVCKAGAAAKRMPLYRHISQLAGTDIILPVPFFNVINGGKHAGNALDIQEFMIAPVGASNFREALEMGATTYHVLKNIIKERYGKDAVNVGDEGGFAPPLVAIEEPIVLLNSAIRAAGYEGKIRVAFDAAASEFYKDGKYHIEKRILSGDDLAALYLDIVRKYNLISVEDPFDQEDFDSYAKLTHNLGGEVQVVGDDLLVTNVGRIKTAIEKKSCNALLLKVNQIGTVTESIEAARLATSAGWKIMVSHRSGETEDSFIADLAVGLGTGQIKSGAPCRSERLAKYNQLMRIEEQLGQEAAFYRF